MVSLRTGSPVCPKYALFTSIRFLFMLNSTTQSPSPALIRLLLEDSREIFRAQPVIETTEGSQSWSHEPCMRFLSDMVGLVDGSKRHAHIGHKLMFYLSLIARLPAQASKDLIDAVQVWERKMQNSREDVAGASVSQNNVRRGKLVEELT
jgi:hypothetical protein